MRGRRRTSRTIFISYNFNVNDGWGFGNNTFTTKNNTITVSDIKEVEKEIKKRYGYNEVVIMNYQIM